MEQFETAKNDNFDLFRGYKEYESIVKNLNGIFEKVGHILNVDEYKEQLKVIQEEIENDKSINLQMPSNEMQLEYESMALSPYIDRLNELTRNVEDDILPFYELHLLSSKIDIQISRITEDTISEIIDNTILLINALNSLNTHNKEDKNRIINKAYKTIYKVILNEEIFGRGDILDYLKKLNIAANRENIGRLLSNDLKKLDQEAIIDDDLKSLTDEKLGNDYLSHEIIKKISIITVGNENSEYQERKRKAIDEVREDVIALANEKNTLTSALSKNSQKIRNMRIRKSMLLAKAASFVLVPIIAFSVGNSIGKKSSAKITEYQTITRTIDYDSGKIIGEEEYKYDEEKSPYSATILSCTPWRKNPAGVGYIRNVTTYEYIAPDQTEENHKIDAKDLEENVKEKYKYIETKDELTKEDSEENTTILITESYQDGQTRKSTKYVIPFTVTGVILGLLIDLILLLTKVYNFEQIRRIIEKLNSEIESNKFSNEEIKKRLKEMIEEAEKVKDKYNEVVKKYGSWNTELIIDDIDTSWITDKKPKRLIKK